MRTREDMSKFLAKLAEETAKRLITPFYKDAIRPAAKEIGNGLGSVVRMVNRVLFLTEDAVSAMDQVIRLSAEQLLLLPPDRIIAPDPRIAVPLLEDSCLTYGEDELRIMFANLLASSMDRDKTAMVHPMYIQIIRNISADEARIIGRLAPLGRAPMIEFIQSGDYGSITESYDELSNLADLGDCRYPDRFPLYVQNLKRLGMLTSSSGTQFCAPGDYATLEAMPMLDKLRSKNPHLQKENFKHKMFILTVLGRAFSNTVVGANVDENITNKVGLREEQTVI